MDEKEILELCDNVDSFIAEYLTESIVHKMSYDMLEAHYGILPVSRNSFYRKRRKVLTMMQKISGKSKNG